MHHAHPARPILRDDPAASRRTLADVVVHLRCDACDARPVSVHLTETPLPTDVTGDIVPGWHPLLHGEQSN